jgi:tetratricopeptide (TPR) repeat protein
VDEFDRPEERVEFSYRAGRIYDEAGLPDKAIPYYEATLVRGAGLPLYFAANAALHLGQIHEEAGRLADAEAAYRRCLQLKDHAYASSISSKAKAGLNRLR